MKEQWKPVVPFGNGMIFAKGNERKIVTPGMSDFHYMVDVAQLVSALYKTQKREKVPALKK